MDYGKFKYQERKKSSRNQDETKIISVKGKVRQGTDDGDYNIKLRNLIRFLERR